MPVRVLMTNLLKLVLFFVILSADAMSAKSAPEDDELNYRYTLGRKKQLPVSLVERPLVLPARQYEISSQGYFTRGPQNLPLVGLDVAAKYGIAPKWDIGVVLIPVTFSSEPTSGIQTPEFVANYELYRGAVEVALNFSSRLPILGEISPTLKLLTRIHLGKWAYLDAGAYGRYQFFDARSTLMAGAPLGIGLRILKNLALFAKAEVYSPDLVREDWKARIEGQVAYTFEDKTGPFMDIGVGYQPPEYVIIGNDMSSVVSNDIGSFRLFAQFFFLEDPDYRPFEF